MPERKYKKYKSSPVLTKRSWPKELKIGFEGDYTLLYGYLDCVDRTIPVLEKMVKNAKSLEELQNQILAFTEQQRELCYDVSVKASSENSFMKYGLPNIPGP